MRQTTIPQKDFLKKTCFFYASGIDPDLRRRVDNAPLSVVQAYKKHVQKWFVEGPDAVDCLIVRYEDLVTAPEEAFQRIFDYLNLDCPLAKGFLSLEVSLYDDTREHRASVVAWKRHAEKYRVLLDAVYRTLSDEIRILGYESSSDGQTSGARKVSVNSKTKSPKKAEVAVKKPRSKAATKSKKARASKKTAKPIKSTESPQTQKASGPTKKGNARKKAGPKEGVGS